MERQTVEYHIAVIARATKRRRHEGKLLLFAGFDTSRRWR
jgi:hypothetical protein